VSCAGHRQASAPCPQVPTHHAPRHPQGLETRQHLVKSLGGCQACRLWCCKVSISAQFFPEASASSPSLESSIRPFVVHLLPQSLEDWRIFFPSAIPATHPYIHPYIHADLDSIRQLFPRPVPDHKTSRSTHPSNATLSAAVLETRAIQGVLRGSEQ
jgi:hypothetical protein